MLVYLEPFDNRESFKEQFKQMGYTYSGIIEDALDKNRVLTLKDENILGWIVIIDWKYINNERIGLVLNLVKARVQENTLLEVLKFMKNSVKEFDRIIHYKVPIYEKEIYKESGFTQIETLINYENNNVIYKDINCDVDIVCAESKHLERIIEIDRVAFEEFWHESRKKLEIDLLSKDTDRRFVIAIKDNIIVGYEIYRYTKMSNLGYVERIAVDPTYQGKNIGAFLLHDSMKWMKEKGTKSIELITQIGNGKSRPLYEKSGFEVKQEYAVMEYIFKE